MKSKLVTAVVKSGLIPEDLIAQMQKWGMHVDVVDEKKKAVAMGRFTIVIVQAGKTEGE